MRGLPRRVLVFVRWWFGLTYLVAGVGGIIAAPIMLASGNGGGVYMFLGALVLIALGWLVRPYGLEHQPAKYQR